MTSLSVAEEIKTIQAEIAHYQEKYEVQQKRIQFLKRENEELKEKQANDGVTSQEIKEQNERFKKKNRELKVICWLMQSQLNELKQVMMSLNT